MTIVIGDVMYVMALEAFLSIKEDSLRKEAALKKLIRTVIYTGSGEFIELLSGAKNIVSGSGALGYAKEEINAMIKKAESLNNRSKMRTTYKNALINYSKKMLRLL